MHKRSSGGFLFALSFLQPPSNRPRGTCQLEQCLGLDGTLTGLVAEVVQSRSVHPSLPVRSDSKSRASMGCAPVEAVCERTAILHDPAEHDLRLRDAVLLGSTQSGRASVNFEPEARAEESGNLKPTLRAFMHA